MFHKENQEMKVRFVLGLATGVLLVLAIQWGYPRIAGRVYVVRSIGSYYPHKNENAQVTLTVYERGKSGHVRQVLCLFPPDFQLQGDNEHGWTGIGRVRLKGVAERYMFGEIGYRAEKVE
jgi:hypothetical protein